MVLRLVRPLILAFALALASCDPRAPVPEVAASQGSPALPTPTAPVLFPAVEDPSPVEPVAVEPLIPDAAIDLIVSFEIGSPEVYERKYRAPVYPGGASGPTVGIGYDLGMQSSAMIIVDWEAHPHAARMATAAGISGPISRDWVRKAADISVTYGDARRVFDQTSVVEHYRLARRAFGAPFDRAPGLVRGAITSLVFNRGGAMSGGGEKDSRREMRAIRDVCLPAQNWPCVASELRSMNRLWVGSTIENGMRRRREAEARLVEAA